MNIAVSIDTLASAGRWVFPKRLFVGLGFLAAGLLFIRPRGMFGEYEVAGTIVSFMLVVAGLALRCWGSGSAGNHTHEGEIKAPRLATGGPYAYVRNPIYLGTIILAFGMVGLIGDPWLLPLCVLALAFLYVVMIPAEETFLRQRFGAAYGEYCSNVPRIIPRLYPWDGHGKHRFHSAALRGEVAVALLLVIIYVVMRVVADWRG